MFALAGEAAARGDFASAETLFRALTQDPDVEIRAEARFRLGMMLKSQKRYVDAALVFRALIDEKPDAARVRLELAEVLALSGDEGGARRQLRQAQATGLPPEVALVVDQFSTALRASKPLGGSLEVSIAPDSNINRATQARQLDTVIAPLTLSDDARRKSGIGLSVSAQAYARLPLASGLSFVPRLSGQSDLYGDRDFNQITTSAQLGLEWRPKTDRINPSVGVSWFHYGGRLYSRSPFASVNWLHRAGRKGQIDATVTLGRTDFQLNDLEDGTLLRGELSYERAFTARSGGSIGLTVARQSARHPGYATWAPGLTLLHWRDIGRTTLFASASARRLVADERQPLFLTRRRETFYRLSVGAVFRRMEMFGFAPVVRLGYEHNSSTVAIYAYDRVSTTIGITRAF